MGNSWHTPRVFQRPNIQLTEVCWGLRGPARNGETLRDEQQQEAISACRPEGATGGEDVPEACECEMGGLFRLLAGCRNSSVAQNTGTHTQGGE